MPYHITDQIAQALPFVVPRAFIMDIAKGPLNGIGTGTIRWQPQQHKARVGGSPLLDRFGFMNPVVVDHNRDPPHPALRVGAIQQAQQVTKSRIGFSGAEAMEALARGEIERPSEIVFFIFPGRHDFLLAPLGHPGRSDLGQQMHIELIGKDHHLARWQARGMKPKAGQARDPLRIIIFGHQLGPLPHPAHFMEPAAYGPSRNLQPGFGLELGCQRGPTPPRPAPTIGPWWRLEECPQSTLDPGQQDRRPHRRQQLAVGIACEAQLPSTIEAHNTVDTGARTAQEGRDVSRIAASGTQK